MSKRQTIKQTIISKILRAGSKILLGSDATGDTYYRNASGLFTRLPVGSTGQVLQVAGGLPSWATPAAGGDFTWKVKTATESVISSNTQQDDDDLFFTATANKTYAIILNLIISTNGSGSNGFVGHLNTPSLAGGLSVIMLKGTVYQDMNPYIVEANFPIQVATAGGCTNLGAALPSDVSPQSFLFSSSFKVGSSGGTVKLRWAQWSANATATKLHNGSFLAYKQLD